MGKLQRNQKGFSVVELVMVIVIVGLIGTVGWLVHNKQAKKTISTSSSKTDTKTTLTTPATNPTADWLKYTSQNNKYSVAVPDGWQLLSSKGSDDLFAFESSQVTFTNGTPAQVDTNALGGDGAVFSFSYDSSVTQNPSLYSLLTKVKTYTTPNGIVVDKYTRTQTTEPADGTQDIAKGTVEYVYNLNGKGVKSVIIYDIRVGETDQTQHIEDAIATLKFL